MKILVVDDHECIRQGVRSILSFRPDIEVSGEAVDGKEAIEKADQLQPDLIILDVTMPVLSGLAAARAIRKILPETRILMFSAYDEKVLIEEAKKLGVDGYLTKTRGGEALLRAVDALSANFFPEPD